MVSCPYLWPFPDPVLGHVLCDRCPRRVRMSTYPSRHMSPHSGSSATLRVLSAPRPTADILQSLASFLPHRGPATAAAAAMVMAVPMVVWCQLGQDCHDHRLVMVVGVVVVVVRWRSSQSGQLVDELLEEKVTKPIPVGGAGAAGTVQH